MNTLPLDIIAEIAEHLSDWRDVVRFAGTSRKIRERILQKPAESPIWQHTTTVPAATAVYKFRSLEIRTCKHKKYTTNYLSHYNTYVSNLEFIETITLPATLEEIDTNCTCSVKLADRANTTIKIRNVCYKSTIKDIRAKKSPEFKNVASGISIAPSYKDDITGESALVLYYYNHHDAKHPQYIYDCIGYIDISAYIPVVRLVNCDVVLAIGNNKPFEIQLDNSRIRYIVCEKKPASPSAPQASLASTAYWPPNVTSPNSTSMANLFGFDAKK